MIRLSNVGPLIRRSTPSTSSSPSFFSPSFLFLTLSSPPPRKQASMVWPNSMISLLKST